MSEFGFFFFLRIAVAVSSTCGGSVRAAVVVPVAMPTSLCSAPDASLRAVSGCAWLATTGGEQRTSTGPPWAWSGLVRPTCWGGDLGGVVKKRVSWRRGGRGERGRRGGGGVGGGWMGKRSRLPGRDGLSKSELGVSGDEVNAFSSKLPGSRRSKLGATSRRLWNPLETLR